MNRNYFWAFVFGGLLAFFTSRFEISNVKEEYKQDLNIKNAEQDVLVQGIQDLNLENDSLRWVIKNTNLVTATVYYPTGHEMRSGKLIPHNYHQSTAHTKFLAISQDLWDRNGGPYSFGDSVRITGTPYDGIYVIQDTMNKRWKNKIDILVSGNVNEKWMNVKICKV